MNVVSKCDILKDHNDYELPISSNRSEQIRKDPFDLGDTFKGLLSVNHKRNLSNYAEQLVTLYAKYQNDHYELYLDMLPDSEQNEIARLYIESTDRETSECVYGNDFSIENEYTCALLAMLQDDSKENRAKFAEVTRKNILTYYKESLQEIIDNACETFFYNMMDDRGYHAQTDMEHGDVVWRKYG